MRRKLLLIAVLGAAIFPGCKKSSSANNSTQAITNVSDIKVPNGFNWQSTHNVNFTAAITDTRFGAAMYNISIYDSDPNAGGHLLATGSATNATAYTNKLTIANQLSQVYVVKTAPDNSKIISIVNVSGAAASVSFGATDPTVPLSGGRGGRGGRTSEERTTLDCSSGCTTTITASTSSVNVNTGNVICITGSNITVSFSSVNGGMIRVCGTNVTLEDLNLNGSAELLVTSSGSATASSLNFNSSTAEVDNEGTLTGSFSDNGIFLNNGTYTSTSDFNINSSAGAFNNNGTMTVNGNFNNSAATSPVNGGSLTITGNFQQNSSSVAFINNCSMKVSGSYNQSGPVQNYSLIKVLGTTTLNSGELGLYNTAMFEAGGGFVANTDVKGYGSTSLVKITGSVTINSGGVFTGALQVSSTASISSIYLTSGAATGSSLYVPVTSCNSDGNGAATITDTDGDGVPDSLDAYPTDPTRAYNSYYPTSATSGTVAYEDSWPRKGDYDMNDVVMGYQYKIVTNAANNVVQVIAYYTLYATGGNDGNGFAIEFPITSSAVTGLTGGTQQSGQTYAVITVFTNMRSEMPQWNTVVGATYATPKSYTISFNVTSGPAISTLGLSSYNPFIMVGTGAEVHLPGHVPSSLANAALFGTGVDNTNVSASTYYVTTTGLPYALDLPISPFSYPTEGADITTAYLHFGAWAVSSATMYNDWYSNLASGYRNTANIYTH
jgi:LruC domain-containing protein